MCSDFNVVSEVDMTCCEKSNIHLQVGKKRRVTPSFQSPDGTHSSTAPRSGVDCSGVSAAAQGDTRCLAMAADGHDLGVMHQPGAVFSEDGGDTTTSTAASSQHEESTAGTQSHGQSPVMRDGAGPMPVAPAATHKPPLHGASTAPSRLAPANSQPPQQPPQHSAKDSGYTAEHLAAVMKPVAITMMLAR